MSSSIAVLGAGGVGGLVAAALARAGEPVTVVAREATAEAIGRDGIRVRSVRLGDFAARPAAVVASLDEPVDVLLVAPKATGLAAALERVRTEPGLVVPLLNGLEHMAVLRERFGDRVAAGVIRVESDRPEPGVVQQTSPFLRVDMASDGGALRPALESLAARLEAAGVPAVVGTSEADVLWSKLVRLNALALVTSAYDLPLGPIRSTPELSAELKACVIEGATVARAEGAEIEGADVLGELAEAHPELGSSMQRDIAAGREPELDAIAGAVLRAGARHGIDCPTVARLAARVADRAGADPTANPGEK
jgi:2-dehydropantoate 2-reductase